MENSYQLQEISSVRNPLINLHNDIGQNKPIGSQKISVDQLNLKVLAMVDDQSQNSKQKINLESLLLSGYKNFRPISPENNFLLIWHCVIAFVILYHIFQIGLLIAFGRPVWIDEFHYMLYPNIAFLIILLLDIFVCPLKSYYQYGFLITRKQKIIKRYIRVELWMDILSLLCVALPYITGIYQVNYIRAIFLIRIYQLFNIDNDFQRLVQHRLSLNVFYMLFRLVVSFFFASHYIGIGFYLVDYQVYASNYYGPNTPLYCWIYNASARAQIVVTLDWIDQYIYLIYFSTGTMTTIAYGDITPLNPISAVYIIFAYIPFTLGFAYIMSQILRIVLEAQAYRFQYTNSLIIMANLMKAKKIKDQLQVNIRSYFQESWLQQKYRNRQIQKQLINQLPIKTKTQLLTSIHEKFLRNILFILPNQDIQMIKNSQKQTFLLSFISQIQEQRLTEGQVLYYQEIEQSTVDHNPYMYYVQSKNHSNSITLGVGKLPVVKEYQITHSNARIQQNYKNCLRLTHISGLFGQSSFFTGCLRSHWARTNRSCLVYLISRNIYLELKNQAISFQQRQHLFYVQSVISLRKCYICKEQNHQFEKCPYVTYVPKKQQIVLKHTMRKNKHYRKSILKVRYQRQAKSIKNNALKNYKQLKSTLEVKSLKIKKSMMISKHYRIQQIDSDSESCSSSKSSQDLDNYINETKALVNKLLNQQSQQFSDQQFLEQFDKLMNYQIFFPQQNSDKVIKDYNELLQLHSKRREVRDIKILMNRTKYQ